MTLSRRDMLALGGVGLVAGVSPLGRGERVAADEPAATTGRQPVLRAAHITDVHIMPERNAPEGAAALFAHLLGQPDWTPDMVLNTGDTVMAIDGSTSGERAEAQIAVWQETVKACSVPIHSCLGNHDVWNGNAPTDAIPAKKRGFDLMTEVLGMPAPYYSFDQAGWHIISLNSMCAWPKYAFLTDEHLAWLKADLAANTRPTVILSHVPILSITSQVYGDAIRKGNDNVLPGTWHHADCWILSEIFRQHPEVKLCLSGHMHTQDRCEYRGVTYICGGAASGAWWNGSEYGFPPCYGRVDLFDDGTWTYDFVDYGWSARQWRGKQYSA